MAQKYIPFTKEMKKDYKLLIPNMLPVHFRLIVRVLRNYGFDAELLETTGAHIGEMGLRYVHNDTCYPAILVIGQFLDAIKSGKYDPRKTALVLFQTGGGCRASNYVSLLRKALERAGYGYVPVIAPIGVGEDGESYNINADYVAADIAGALHAEKLLLLTDTEGVYKNFEDKKSFISTLKSDEARTFIKDGTISGGMIPKVEACLRAIDAGTNKAYIIDGRLPHSIILELFTAQGIGTEVK